LKFKEQMVLKEQGTPATAAAAAAAAPSHFVPSFGSFVASVPQVPVAAEVSLVTVILNQT